LIYRIKTVVENDDVIEIICQRTESKFPLLVGVLAADWGAVQLELYEYPAGEVASRYVHLTHDRAVLLAVKRGNSEQEEADEE